MKRFMPIIIISFVAGLSSIRILERLLEPVYVRFGWIVIASIFFCLAFIILCATGIFRKKGGNQ